MLNIARALISAAAFLELSGDDEVDPDSAVKALEAIASYLRNATPEETEIIRAALQIERDESVQMGWAGNVEFIDGFMEAFAVGQRLCE